MKNQQWERTLGRVIAGCMLLLVPLAAANWLSPRAVASTTQESTLSFNSLKSAFDGPAYAKLDAASSDQSIVLDDWTYTSRKTHGMWNDFVKHHDGRFQDDNSSVGSKWAGNSEANKSMGNRSYWDQSMQSMGNRNHDNQSMGNRFYSNQFMGNWSYGNHSMGNSGRSYGNQSTHSFVDHKSAQFARFQHSEKNSFNREVKQEVPSFTRHLGHEVVAFFSHPQNSRGLHAFEQHLDREFKFSKFEERGDKNIFIVVLVVQKEQFEKNNTFSACTP